MAINKDSQCNFYELNIAQCDVDEMKKICDKFRILDMVILNTTKENNAKSFLQIDYNEIKEEVNRNYLLTAKLLNYFAEKMARKREGSIIVLGSEQNVSPGFPERKIPIVSSLYALCEAIRGELVPLGITLQYYPLKVNDKKFAKVFVNGIIKK